MLTRSGYEDVRVSRPLFRLSAPVFAREATRLHSWLLSRGCDIYKIRAWLLHNSSIPQEIASDLSIRPVRGYSAPTSLAPGFLFSIGHFSRLLRGLDLDSHLTESPHCWITGYIHYGYSPGPVCIRCGCRCRHYLDDDNGRFCLRGRVVKNGANSLTRDSALVAWQPRYLCWLLHSLR